jgi:hypothetical protein
MADYPKMYKRLFNAQTQAIEILQKAQQDTEEMYIEAPDADIHLLDLSKRNEDSGKRE